MANASYSLCPTYPAIMFGPNTINEDTLDGLRLIRATALFQAGGRMQTLAWASLGRSEYLAMCPAQSGIAGESEFSQ